MPALSTLALFLLAALGLLLIPGPSVLYIITRSVAHGRRAGLASVLGVESASLTHAAAASLGLSALLLTSALAFSVVKYLGAAYLIYLGARTLLAREERQRISAPVSMRYPQLFARGFLVNLLNPKTALFFYAFLPQFVDPARGTVVGQTLLLGTLFVLLASCTDSLYALLSSTMGQWFTRNVRIRQNQRYISGSVYILLGVAAAFAGSEKK
ncbi:MAG TPA: LysE family translocator [Ktedonobacteraceae bacterium]|nr:LysE family translocator [Ktedonobacteraceae bacterium]